MPPKRPFVGYTAEEVMAFEAVTYILQVGSDVFDIKGKLVFTKKGAQIYYNKVLRELLDQIKNGTKKQKKNAMRALLGLKVLPLRIH